MHHTKLIILALFSTIYSNICYDKSNKSSNYEVLINFPRKEQDRFNFFDFSSNSNE